MNKREEDKALMTVNSVLIIVILFAVMPFVTMLVWNVLVAHLFSVSSIGYGGAFAIMLVRGFFFGKAAVSTKGPEEALKDTFMAIFKIIATVIGTLIVGYFIGAL